MELTGFGIGKRRDFEQAAVYIYWGLVCCSYLILLGATLSFELQVSGENMQWMKAQPCAEFVRASCHGEHCTVSKGLM